MPGSDPMRKSGARVGRSSQPVEAHSRASPAKVQLALTYGSVRVSVFGWASSGVLGKERWYYLGKGQKDAWILERLGWQWGWEGMHLFLLPLLNSIVSE